MKKDKDTACTEQDKPSQRFPAHINTTRLFQKGCFTLSTVAILC